MQVGVNLQLYEVHLASTYILLGFSGAHYFKNTHREHDFLGSCLPSETPKRLHLTDTSCQVLGTKHVHQIAEFGFAHITQSPKIRDLRNDGFIIRS